jgi:selenide,water dikinase
VLGRLPRQHDPRLLVGNEHSDDAAVYRVSDELALVQTVDYFTPVVDDPYDFGRVAAANALSDVYAMGGEPFMALNLVGFPVGTLPLTVLERILEGGAAVCREAGVVVAGGHSIDDPEPKFGLAVTGRVDPDRMILNRAGRSGDVLVLTKPLGVGILTTAIKRALLSEEEVSRTVDLMTVLNRGASEAAREAGVTAGTDVTGYGLLGHLYELAAASGVEAEVWGSEVPVLMPRVRELAAQGVVPGGTRKNLRFIEEHADFADALTPEDRLVLADAQTSGGLLLAVAEDHVSALIQGLKRRGTPAAARIGRLLPGTPGRLHVLERP